MGRARRGDDPPPVANFGECVAAAGAGGVKVDRPIVEVQYFRAAEPQECVGNKPSTRLCDASKGITHASCVEHFMEWVTRMDMDMEWISGGYGYF